MKTVLSIDYELFFGPNAGTLEKSLLDPTSALVRIADRFGFKFVFFVDAGFLVRLREESVRCPVLRVDLDAVRKQLEELHRRGHDLQLHIHPHWEDCHWDGTKWVMDTRRYRLHDFGPSHIEEIVSSYKAALAEFSGNEEIFAYRAGGWVIQPFDRIRDALRSNGIYLDSTVFPGGTRNSATHFFDFRGAPDKSYWRFEVDPLFEQDDGYFLEVPIASHEWAPSFSWKYALVEKFGGDSHRPLGNGTSLRSSTSEIFGKLTGWSRQTVSFDGYKASFLQAAYEEYARKGRDCFVAIGHSKLQSKYSLELLQRFCHETGAEITTFRQFCRSNFFQKHARATS